MCTMMGTMYPSDLIVVIRVLGRLTGSSVRHVARSLFPFPTSRVGIPNTVGEQAIQIGKIRIAVAVEA